MKQEKIIDLPGEIWLPVKGFEGYYEVSNMGRVKSLDVYRTDKNGFKRFHKGKLISLVEKSEGYIEIMLYGSTVKRKNKRVHIMVAEAFIPNPDPINFDQVNHKNEIKNDNRAENLEWCDSTYNNNYGTKKQRAAEKFIKGVIAKNAKGEIVGVYKSQKQAARLTGANYENISMCLHGRRKTTGGLYWERAV